MVVHEDASLPFGPRGQDGLPVFECHPRLDLLELHRRQLQAREQVRAQVREVPPGQRAQFRLRLLGAERDAEVRQGEPPVRHEQIIAERPEGLPEPEIHLQGKQGEEPPQPPEKEVGEKIHQEFGNASARAREPDTIAPRLPACHI